MMYRLREWALARRDASKKVYDDGVPKVIEMGLNRIERSVVAVFVGLFTIGVLGFWWDASAVLTSGEPFQQFLLGILLVSMIPLSVGYLWGLKRIVRSAWLSKDCKWCRDATTDVHALEPPASSEHANERLAFCSRRCRQCWEHSNLEEVPEPFLHVQTYTEERQGGGKDIRERFQDHRSGALDAAAAD